MAESRQDSSESDGNAPPPLAQFETSLAELETLVETLESGEIGLEQALAQFERGVTLTRHCRDLLKNAELRVDQLLADSDEPQAMETPSEAADSDTTD